MENTVTKPRTQMTGATKTRMLVQIGMLAAVATVLMLFEFPLPFLAPTFYEMDFSEVPVLIGSFAMGPLAGASIELVKILLNLIINGTNTAFVGEFANFVMGCAFVVPAGWIYKHHKTRKQACIGFTAGTVAMAITACFMNAFLLLPAYGKAFGMPVDAFVQMGTAINPAINSLFRFALLTVAPFNLLKGILVSALTLLLYKHISKILKGHTV
ncbi:MAG: ECF transporter S component [Lachnospiraceae bacterium]|nr:ECF transporter S component [Lachnospiraceae bacterium]